MKGFTDNSLKEIRLPLILTAIIHLGALLAALFGSRLVPEQLNIPEFYQVELYTAQEAQPEPQSAPPQAPRAEIEPQPITAPPPSLIAPPQEPTKPVITAPPPPTTTPVQKPPQQTVAPPVPPPANHKAVSLSPIKADLLRESREREEQARQKQQQIEQMLQIKQNLQKQGAEEQVREEARLASKAIAEAYRSTQPRTATSTQPDNAKPLANEATPPGVAKTHNEVSPEVNAAYKATLTTHIGRNWSLPDLQGWDKSLTTRIDIKMKSNGMVAPGGVTISSSSGNARFDREAMKAVKSSLPLPPLPQEFGRDGEEIAVTFTPSGLK